MRNMITHAFGALMIVATGGMFATALDDTPTYQYSPIESLVDIRAEAKFTGSPHPVFAYSIADLEWIAERGTMLKLKEFHADRILVLFKGFFQNSGADRAGVGTVNGNYVWKDPVTMRKWIQYFRDVLGFDVYVYVAPYAWREDNLSARQFIDQALRLRQWSGGDLHLYCDGYQFGGTHIETEATLRALKEAHGFKLFIHGSLAPNLGTIAAGQEAEYRMPGAELATVFLHGETNLPKTDLINWFRATSYIQHAHVNTIHKPARPKKDKDGNIIRANPIYEHPAFRAALSHRYLMIWRISKRDIDEFETHYWPGYEAARKRFEADRVAFVRERAVAFQR